MALTDVVCNTIDSGGPIRGGYFTLQSPMAAWHKPITNDTKLSPLPSGDVATPENAVLIPSTGVFDRYSRRLKEHTYYTN